MLVFNNSFSQKISQKSIKKKNFLVSNHQISGSVTGFFDNDIVKLMDQELMMPIDSAYIKDGKFVLKHNINTANPRVLSLVIISETLYYVRLYISNENIQIKGDKNDFPYTLKISGSKSQNLQQQLDKKYLTLQKERDEIIKFLREEVIDTNEVYKAKNRKAKLRVRQIMSKIDSIKIKFINENSNSYTALKELSYLRQLYSKAELQKIYNRLLPKYKNYEAGKSLYTYLKIGEIIKQGDAFFDFEAFDQFGVKHRLSDFKENFILIDFTKEYCEPCELAIKELKILNEKYRNKLKIISFTGEKSKEFWKKGILRNNINWLCMWDGCGVSGNAILKYGIFGFPNFVLINPDGIIVKIVEGYSPGILEPEILRFIKP